MAFPELNSISGVNVCNKRFRCVKISTMQIRKYVLDYIWAAIILTFKYPI